MSGNARAFVRGAGRFLDDVTMPGLLHLRVVPSRYARAELVRVRGGINRDELRATMPISGEGGPAGARGVTHPVVAQDCVNYVGQPVAGVLDTDPARAEDLIESVEVEYAPLPPTLDPEEAERGSPIHPGMDSNVLSDFRLGAEFEDLDAPVAVRERWENARIAANPMEPRGALARYEGGRLTLWASTQSVFSVRRGVSGALGLRPEDVRVVQTDTGGGFGVKGSAYPEYALAAYAAIRTRRPVKWVETRLEHLERAHSGRGTRADVELFAERDGRVRGLRAELRTDAGAYLVGLNGVAPRFIGMQLTGPYAIPRAFVRARAVYTNKAPLGPYRGAGRPEAAFVIERTMDRLADATGLDPVEVRRRNTSAEPFVSPLGLRVGPTRAFFEEAVRALGPCDAPSPEGCGFSFFALVPAFAPGESARIRAEARRLRVWLGSHAHGQEHELFVRRLVHEELDVPEDSITLEKPDTDALREGVGTWGSRSAMVGGAALVAAARRLRGEIESEAGRYDPERLWDRPRDVALFEEQAGQLNALGANWVRVAVDSLGFAEVREVRAHYDVGHALVPRTVAEQIEGGALQAIGQTLYEELVWGPDGDLRTRSLAEAGVPTAQVRPRFAIGLAEHRSSLPHGARGVGESPTIGLPPALARALERATGRPVRRTPARPHELAAEAV